MKTSPLFLLAFLMLPFAVEAQSAACFSHFQKEGEAAFSKKRFDLARKKFAAAKECPDATGDQRRQMDARIREAEQRNLHALQVEINRAEASEEIAKKSAEAAEEALKTTKIALKTADSLRIESEIITRHALANDLAFKAQVALREGDRTTAFRLVEFASKFVEPENTRVKQVLLDVFYQNDTQRPMPWCLARFDIDDGLSTDYAEFTDDGKFLFVISWSGSIRLFELATGLEVYYLKTPTEIEVIAFASDASAIAFIEPGEGIQIVNPLQPEKLHLKLENSFRDEAILHLEFLPDNKTLLGSWADGTVISWDVKTQKPTIIYEGNSKPVWGGHISENMKWLLLPGFDSQVRVMNAVTGKLENTLQLDNPYVLNIAHSPDYQDVAISTADGHIEIFNLRKAEKRLVITMPGSIPATTLGFSLDGKTLTVTSQNNYSYEVKNFSLVDGRETPIEMGSDDEMYMEFIQSPSGKKQLVVRHGFMECIHYEADKRHRFPIPGNEMVSYFEFSPDERFAFISYYNGAVDIRDTETGRLVCSLPAAGEISTIAFSADNRQFSIARLNGEIEVWPFDFSGQLFPEKLGGYSSTGSFSPDSRLLAVPFSGDSIVVFETEFGRPIYAFAGEGDRVRFSPDGKKLAVFSTYERPAIFIHDAATGKSQHQLSYHPWVAGSFHEISFSPDSRQLTVFSNHAEAMIFNVETGEKQPGLEGCTFVAFSPDNRWAAELRDRMTTLRVINRQTGEVLFSQTDPDHQLANIAFSPDSTRLLARVWQGAGDLLIWKLEPQATPLRLKGSCFGAQEFVKWSPDSKQLYQADGIFRTMDAETGAEKAQRDADDANKTSRLSPDGTKALLSLKGDKCMVRDARTGRDLFPLVGHSKFVTALHFSPDSKWILTTSEDQTARIWDARTGRQQYILRADTFPMTHFEISPDSKKVAIWQDGRPKIWQLDPETMFEQLSAGHAKAVLTARQLYNFNLEEAFRSDDDFKKILAGWSPAQALEGAEFFFQQAELSTQPARFELQYQRSEALFQSVMNRRDKGNLNAQLFELYGRWMEKELQHERFAGAKKRAASFKKMLEIANDHTELTRIRTFQADWLTGNKTRAAADALQIAIHGNRSQLVDAIILLAAGEADVEEMEELLRAIHSSGFLGNAYPIPVDWDTSSVQEFSNREDYFAWQSDTARLDLGKSLAENLHFGGSSELSRNFGNLAFRLLFEKKWDESARLSGYALALDSSQTWVWTNMAHAFLFGGQTEKAKAIYLKWKDETYLEVAEDGQPQTFSPIFLKDFEEFATEKITCRDLPAMVELVSGKKLSKEERARFSGDAKNEKVRGK